MEEVRDWVKKWFIENGNVESSLLEEKQEENYLDAGFIDSFTFIGLIADIEEHFGISFENDQFEDRKFATLNGLIEIIFGMVVKA